MLRHVSIVVALAALLVGCDQRPPNSTQIVAQQQETLNAEAAMQVGMPAIHKFAEKRLLKEIFEERDQELATITYIVDMQGKYHKICDSIGFGIPYSTQFTNPQMITDKTLNGTVTGYYVLPQADPNALFSPASADGTWVECVNPQTKKSVPIYVEPRVIVSQFPLGE